MRKLLAVLLLLAVGGLIALFLFRHKGQDEIVAGPRASSEVTAPTAHAEPTESEPVTQPDERTQREVIAPATPAAVPPVAAETESKDGGATLIVHAIGKADRQPCSKVRIFVHPKVGDVTFGAESSDSSKGDLHHTPVTGSDGLAELELPPEQELVLWAHAEDESAGGIEQDLAALQRGERREIRIELPQGDDAQLAGKVVAAESEAPIAGARVALVEARESFSEPGGTTWTKKVMKEVQTRADGTFELPFASWKSPHLRVEAEGYGLRLAGPGSAQGSAPEPQVIKLVRAATLDARVVDAAGKGISGAWVVLDARGYELGRTEEEERGMFGGEYVSLPDEQWKCETAADGAAHLPGLPAGVRFVAEVRRDGKVLQHEAGELTLSPGETREIEWRIGAGTRLVGLVLDQDHAPVKGQEIWLQACMYEQPYYFQPYEEERIVKRARTDEQGRFVIEDVPAGKWWIGPAAERDHWDEPKPNDVAPCAQVLSTAGEPVRELTLNVFRGLYVRGTVVDPSGAPVANSYVHAAAEGTMIWMGAQSKEDGTFALGPIAAGSYTLTANNTGSFASSDPVRARTGDSDVLLRLKPGATLRGHVVDAATGAGCRAQLTFVAEQAGEGLFGSNMSTSSEPDGSFRHEGFNPGRWSITAMTADGRFAQQGGIDVGAGAESGDIVLALKPGGNLRLVYKGTKPNRVARLLCGGVPVHFGTPLEPGKPMVVPAPAGALVLELREGWEGPARTRALELKSGETQEITLTDED